MRCPNSRFPIEIVVFDELELIIIETLSTTSLGSVYEVDHTWQVAPIDPVPVYIEF